MRKLLLALALALPLPLTAQTGATLSSYVASDGGVQGSPLLLGATLGQELGWVGLRLGAGIDLGSTPLTSGPDAGAGQELGLFATEVDGQLFLGNPTGTAPVVPYALAGVGLRVLRGARAGATGAFWSYGGGVRTPVVGPVSFEGEARFREPLQVGTAVIPVETTAGWEFRFGMNVRVSGAGAGRARIPAPAPLPRPTATGAAGTAEGAAARRRVAERALDTADDYLGVRYTWGGNTPTEGFDCSGFVKFVFAREGISLPRVSRDQARAGDPLPLDLAALEPGDLIAFASRRGGVVDHIAIYAGNGRIIHSSASGNGVRLDDLHSRRGRWYLEHMVAARRVIEAGPWSWSGR